MRNDGRIMGSLAVGSLFSWGGVAAVALWATSALAEVERFTAPEDANVEVWRITHDPTVRDHANYHNQQCFSPDGRYICFTHWASNGKEFGKSSSAEIHVHDFHLDRDVKIDGGVEPRWANRHNWLFYVRYRYEDGPRHEKGAQVMWHDLDTGQTERIGYGVRMLKYTDCDDRWLYGIQDFPDGRKNAVRIAIAPDSPTEVLPGDWLVGYNSLMVNPARPMIVSRDHNYQDYLFTPEGTEGQRFVARHFFDHDLAGRNRTKPFPIMEGSHFSWSGDGSYFMAGNGQMRGTRWDEPLPGNIHFLAAIGCGDISPCGRSGRWICGDSGVAQISVADLRSGHGRTVLETNSFLCFPSGRDNSGPYDIDLKGSPDGTKIGFVSTYDIKNGPVARIADGHQVDSIHVDSTDGFPPQGQLINASGFGGEVIGYRRKTATAFQGLTRGLYGTNATARLYTGRPLTSFETMLIPEDLRAGLPLPPWGVRNFVPDDSPLLMQRSSDLYAVVVRLPDRPHPRRVGDNVELIPGENHWETFGYHIFKDGRKISEAPIRPGGKMVLPGGGTYTAVAVEWSGLESEPSPPLEIADSATLTVLASKPDDFSWTTDRHRIGAREVSMADADRASESIRETVHLHDGVIHRAWYRRGRMVGLHDLNLAGEPTRRLYYEDGKLARREYYDRDGDKASTELFNPAGEITESIRHGSRPRHWWYEGGVPTKYARGEECYVPKGDRWVREN